MIYEKFPTHLCTRKKLFRSNSGGIKSILDATFYSLILIALKVERIDSESANDPDQNLSFFEKNLTFTLDQTFFDFSLLRNQSDITQSIPKIEEYAADVTRFVAIDPKNDTWWLPSNHSASFSITKSSRLLQTNSFNSDSVEEFERNRATTSTLEIDSATNSNDDFCKANNSGVHLNDVYEPTTPRTNSNAKSSIIDIGGKRTIVGVHERTISNFYDDFGESNNSTIDTRKKMTPDPKDFCETDDFATDQGGREGADLDKNGGFAIDEKEYEEAEKMTKCNGKDFNKDGIVCVCNKTYCDKMLPVRRLPSGKYSWYRSSRDGYRFNRLDGQLSRYTNDVKDAFNINTTLKLQKFKGFGGSFSDSASMNIESMSRETREQLMRSYYGAFGLEYNLGKVPIGGTDFSPRFYTYMDVPNKFVLSEQDTKYKIPIIRKALEMSRNKLKLIGIPWTAPKWMKTKCSHYMGELKYEYFQLYADYYAMFLKNYDKNGIKFWSVSPGNRPMIPFNYTQPPYINAMEWSPYKQSKWVNRYLAPTLKKSSFPYVKLIIGDENRAVMPFFVKWFFEPLLGEEFYDLKPGIVNNAYFDVSGISFQGYWDVPDHEVYLNRTHQLYPEKFMLLVETACYGKPKLGAWHCAERYAKQLLNYFNGWTTGFIDWNLALDLEGGPNYLNLSLDAAIIIDPDKDEFYKQPVYYVIGHFSKFLPPDSVRVLLEPFNRTSTGVAAIAAQRPDEGTVIVAYNRSPRFQNVVFVIDKKYTLSLNVSAKSINSVIFWMD